MAVAVKKASVGPAIDAHKDILYPLDYSFKGASSFSDILHEKPRSRDWKAVLDLNEEEAISGTELVKSHSTSLRVNNNMIVEWTEFWSTVELLFVDPASHLQWVDLSFNDIKTIDEVLLKLPNLTMLYLHANSINRLHDVERITSLHRLRSLTLHGNPIETIDGYRMFIISRMPQLQNLDFSCITKSDRQVAARWLVANPPRKPKKKKQES